MHLLITEDDMALAQGLQRALQEKNRQVLCCKNIQETRQHLHQNKTDLLILDVNLPDGSGFDLLQEIRRTSDLPVILLTANDLEMDIVSGLEQGANDYITKPFNLEILLLRIRKLLMWTLKNHDKFKTRDISPSEITISSLDEQLIEKAIRIVEENMDNSEFSVEELSAQIGMSRSGLYKKLMQITGKSPLEFMRILRLKRGRKLLEGSQMNISQISYQVGLSPKQFAKFFKEEFGYLPSEYKKKEEK